MKSNQTIFFGKYRGSTWEEVKNTDPGYLIWCRNNLNWMDDPQPVRDLIDSMFTVSQDLMEDQQQAADEIAGQLLNGPNRVHRLQGGAGYGKSYVVTEIAQLAKQAGLTITGIANSYVATQVLAESLDPVAVPSKTIASALALAPNKDKYEESYGPSERTEENLRALLCDDSLLIVDEYSMCSDMVTDLIYGTMNNPDNNAKLLVVGDNCQLPSPEQEHMCRFDEITPFSELTIPKRFDPGSTLHVLEKSVRGDAWNLANYLTLTTGDQEILQHPNKIKLSEQMLSDMDAYPEQTALMLFYKRADVAAANKLIRAACYGDTENEIEDGERLRVMRTTFMPTYYDLEKEKWEYRRYYSGTFLKAIDPEVYTIEVSFDHESLPYNQCPTVEVECLVTLDSEGHRVPVVFSKSEHSADPSTFGGSEFNQALNTVKQYCADHAETIRGVWKLYHHFRSKFLQVSYGYATTIHRSQGASVDRIYLNPKDVLQGGKFIAPRLAYVAATRAKKQIHYTV